MNIGIDIDDTINDLLEIKFTYMQDYVANVLNRKIKLYDFENIDKKYFEVMHGLNENEMIEFLDLYYEKMISNVKPKTLAVKIINKLKSEGNRIIIITTRPNIKDKDVFKITKEWLNQNKISFDKLIITDNKREAVEKENVEVFIDDKYKLCKQMQDITNSILFQSFKNYNIDLKESKITRAYSWPHVYQLINKISN